nr:MAG TPA: hypothetical protein [Caudoviricetes sp.]
MFHIKYILILPIVYEIINRQIALIVYQEI